MFGSLSQHQIRKRLLAAESEINRAQLIQELAVAKVQTEKITQQVLKIGAVVSTVALAVAALKALRKGPSSPAAVPKTSWMKPKASWLTKIFKGARLATSVWSGFKAASHNGRETA